MYSPIWVFNSLTYTAFIFGFANVIYFSGKDIAKYSFMNNFERFYCGENRVYMMTEVELTN